MTTYIAIVSERKNHRLRDLATKSRMQKKSLRRWKRIASVMAVVGFVVCLLGLGLLGGKLVGGEMSGLSKFLSLVTTVIGLGIASSFSVLFLCIKGTLETHRSDFRWNL